ncbi:MAG: thioesterase [Acidobacteriota bacterium]|jgi:acyl-ACP thioesterase|nr:thioesterase [Acidobacteriota bacterium]
MKARHRDRFRVRSYETDPLGRLQVPILCKLLQEAATAHAAILGVAVDTLIENGVAWVLSRLHLEMQRWPTSDEYIVIETWPEAANRLFTERRFNVVDAADNRIGTASTLWLILDLERRRPVRLPAHVVERLGELGLGSEPRRFGDLVTPDPVDRELAFTVRRSDLDLADHVNNTSYVEWAIEAVPDEVWSSNELAELEIQFVSECRQGQTVLSRSRQVDRGDDIEVRHQLMRHEDGAEVARARTIWRRT